MGLSRVRPQRLFLKTTCGPASGRRRTKIDPTDLRLSRTGNRQLNAALNRMAMTQASTPTSSPLDRGARDSPVSAD